MLILLLCLILSVFFTKPVFASNTYGLHLTQTSDINTAYSIINSSGGDWGWATIVLRTDQLDKNTWQEFFNKCRQYHIIPIIRLATNMENNSWLRPTYTDIDNIANFLNSLNWPTKEQHVILFNEINHGQEWEGAVDVKNFTDMAIYAAKKFKELNPNFFVLSPGLDLAAPEKPPEFKSYNNVYKEIYAYKPEYFNLFNGLATHYYPENSSRDFNYETKYFKKNIPIFITETGWRHLKPYTCQASAAYTLRIFKTYSKNPQVKAITPFIYNYPNPPFEHFSWLDKNEKLFPEYNIIVNETKKKNKPEQITKYEFQKIHLPIIMLTNKEYIGQIYIKNTGQSIWGETPFCLNPHSSPNITLDAICADNLVSPNQIKIFTFKFTVHSSTLFNKSYLSFGDLPQIEITPLNSTSTLYHPKSGIWEKLTNFIQKLVK